MKSQKSKVIRLRRGFGGQERQKFGAGILTLAFILPFFVVSAQTKTVNLTAGNAAPAQTQTLNEPNPTVNPNDSGFSFSVCDGPELPPGVNPPANTGHTYIPCNFNGFMLQAQHAIDIIMVVGVLAAIAGFLWGGALYMTGVESKINEAKDTFKKVGIGFIIMLSGWFIVYQILAWLTGENSGFASLIGKP